MIKTFFQKIGFFIFLILASQACLASAIHLKDVFKSVDKHYPLIKAALAEIRIAKAKHLSAYGPFNSSLESSAFGTPEGGYEHIYDTTALKLPLMTTGATISLGYRVGRGEWPIYEKNYLTNNQGGISAGIHMPLLRGFSIDEQRVALRNTAIGIDLQKAEFLGKSIDIKQQAGIAYWQWIKELRFLSVMKALLTVALERQKILERRHNLGDASEIEKIENERFILDRQEVLTLQRFKVRKASALLSLFLRDAAGKPLAPKPSQIPNDYRSIKVTPKRLQYWRRNKHNILRQFPLIQALHRQIDIEENRLKLAKNNLLPTLDLGYRVEKENGQFGDPLKKIAAHKLGLHFNLPFKQDKARGERIQSLEKLYQLHETLILLKQRLGIEFTNSANEIENDIKRIDLLNKEVALAVKIEKAERTSFEQGNSSLFLVNQREQNTFQLRLKAINVLIDYYLSKLNLDALNRFA